MCDFKSGIVLKDRVYVPDRDSHNQMLSELGLRDDFDTASKLFVRVELSPTDGNKASDVDGWKLKVDQDILPDWWQEPIDLPRVKAAVKDWCAKHILTSGVHEVRDGIWYALGNATVEAGDNATVIHPFGWYGKPNVTVSDGAVFVNHNKRAIATKADFTMEV